MNVLVPFLNPAYPENLTNPLPGNPANYINPTNPSSDKLSGNAVLAGLLSIFAYEFLEAK